MPRKPSEKTTTRKSTNEEPAIKKTTKSPTLDLNLIINMHGGFKAKNKIQKDFAQLIEEKIMVIAAGPAGVGKSYVAIAKALELLKDNTNKFTKIVISKPAVEAEEEHGFIPGTIREKMAPHIESTVDIFDKIIGKANREKLEELGYLVIQPLAFLRGKSIDNSIVLMEEAQNMSPNQMKTLLTRIGESSKFIISGDLDQSDRYKDVTKSGLYDAMQKHRNVEEIGFIEFRDEDIVRNPIISKILANYKKEVPKVKKTTPTTPVVELPKTPEEPSLFKKIFG